MQEILENCLRKHVLIAKNEQKRPKIVLKTLPRAWKMVPQSESPMGEHFSGALVDFPRQTEVK